MSSVDRCATFVRQVICDSRKRYRIAAGAVNGVRNVWVVTSIYMDVTTNSRTAPALLAVMCLGLGACSAPASDSTQGSTTAVVSCASAPLSVTFADLTVKAVNTGTSTCNLSGSHPVELPWWRIVGPGPSPAAGALPPGAALVQAYKPEGSNGCPWPGTPSGAAQLTVSVEGRAHVLSLPSKVAHQITVCDMVSVLSPTIEPPAPSVGR
jgi:hypothetical protein